MRCAAMPGAAMLGFPGSIMSAALANRVRELREARGMSQVSLAAAAQLTRQSISAIEAGRATPAVDVALRIAKALGTRVEELFDVATPDTLLLSEAASAPLGDRVALAQIQGRWVAHSLAGSGFGASADGVARSWAGGRVEVETLRSAGELQDNILLKGCSAALGVLSQRLNSRKGPGRFVWLPGSSTAALQALSKGHVHVAGVHLVDGRTGEANVADVRKHVAKEALALVTLGRWEAGLVLTAGNPKNVRQVADLGQRSLRIVTRELGSGARRLLDQRLKLAGLLVDGQRLPVGRPGRGALPAQSLVASGHLEVAHAVALGAGDVGIATRDAALAFGLDFVPLAEERYDLVVPLAWLTDPRIARLLDELTSASLRKELAALGYDVSSSGDRVAEIRAA